MRTIRPALTSAIALAVIGLVAMPVGASQAQAQSSGGKSAAPARKVEKNFPLGRNWLAVSINGKRYGQLNRPTFVLDSKFRVNGFGGCNTYSAVAYPLRDMGIAVGPLALTRRACPGGQMAEEQAFLAALRYAQKWDVVNGQLVMKGPAGELRFDRSL